METTSKVIHILVDSNHSLATVVIGQHTNYHGNNFDGWILNQLDTSTNGNYVSDIETLGP